MHSLSLSLSLSIACFKDEFEEGAGVHHHIIHRDEVQAMRRRFCALLDGGMSLGTHGGKHIPEM